MPVCPSRLLRAPCPLVLPSSLHMHDSSLGSVSCHFDMSFESRSASPGVLPVAVHRAHRGGAMAQGAGHSPTAAGLHHNPHWRRQQSLPKAGGGAQHGARQACRVGERVWARPKAHTKGGQGAKLADAVLVILIRPDSQVQIHVQVLVWQPARTLPVHPPGRGLLVQEPLYAPRVDTSWVKITSGTNYHSLRPLPG